MHQTIEKLLAEAFSPRLLEVRDDSAQHAGHAGARPEGGTHFHIVMESERFNGLSRVQSHRLVYAVLKPLMEKGLHALQIEAREVD